VKLISMQEAWLESIGELTDVLSRSLDLSLVTKARDAQIALRPVWIERVQKVSISGAKG